MLQRTIAPGFTTDFIITLDSLHTESLTNGIPVYILPTESLDVFRLELVFPFGLLHAPDVETGHFMTRLMALGTENMSALEVAESFEKLGGFLDLSVSNFKTTVTLHGMSKYFERYLPLLSEVIFQPSFPQTEIDIQKNQAKQSYLINSKKTSFIANREFKKAIYGEISSMGQTIETQNIENLNRDSLLQFHQEHIPGKNFEIYFCGKVAEQDLKALQNTFGSLRYEYQNLPVVFPPVTNPQKRTEELENSVQSTLIIGKRLFNRNHPDFIKFLVTNTIFGGYFGSRLMKNIREEKGLTYGISSSLSSNTIDGVFSIKADLNKEKLEEAILEIEKEIGILQSAPVGDEELTTVKNYIKGSILSGTNTIFDTMDKHKAIRNEGLPRDFYETLSSRIEDVQKDQILETANEYLHGFSTIIAG